MMRVLAVVGVLAIFAAACGAGSSSSSSPPSDHGGYGGRQAKIFDAAYRRCYRLYQPIGQSSSDPYKLLTRLQASSPPLDVQAFLDGCNAAGLKTIGGPIILSEQLISSGS